MALAATVVKTALLGAKNAADIGMPAVPLGDLHGKAGAELLQRLGAEVRIGAKVAEVTATSGGGLRVRLRERGGNAASPAFLTNENHAAALSTDAGQEGGSEDRAAPLATDAGHEGGSAIHADGVVLAVPPDVAARLVPADAVAGGAGPGPDRWRELGASPIVNVHVIYDRRVTWLPFAAAVDSPVQWVFDRTGSSGLPAGQYLAVSLSAADDLVDVPAARLRERFVPALEDLFPAARDARITDFFVTRERRATFRQVPGCAALRPGAATALPGLVIAGAWTDTGWPDTMEGAVRSGLNAARELRRGLAEAPPPAGRNADLVAGATA
jgi:hypothetical protein